MTSVTGARRISLLSVRALRKLGLTRRQQLTDALEPVPLADEMRVQQFALGDDELHAVSVPTVSLPSGIPLTADV